MRNSDKILFATMTVLSMVFLMPSGCSLPAHIHTPVNLMVDLLTCPNEAVVTNPKPSFSWAIDDPRQGAKQSAWQIMVASSENNIKKDLPDIWNSGKIVSNKSVNVSYNGAELQPEQKYLWKVRTWDHNNEPGNWSEFQIFHTGKFKSGDFAWPGESRWVKLDINNSPEYVFENRHPVRYHDIQPVSILMNSSGNHLISFEKAAFGTLKLTLDAPENIDTIVIHLGEKLDLENHVDRLPGGSISYIKVKLDIRPGKHEYLVELPRQYSRYPNSQVLPESMTEVTAFRYAEIEGWPGNLEANEVWQHALLYHFNENASDFNSSNDNLNQIWDLCKHTLKVTPFLGLYIDGARERMPYEADAYIQQISHYCVDREFAIQRYTTNFLIFNPSWPTEWHLHIVLMAWADFMATGNADFLKEYYDELKKKTLLPLAREDGLISTRTGLVTDDFLKSIHYNGDAFRDIIDWPQGTPADEDEQRSGFGSIRIEGETDRYVFTDINTVVNAFHYRNLVLMAKIADLLGKTADEAFFKERSELVKTSFNEKLFNKKTGLYTDGEGTDHSSLHANMFPVAFGLAPEISYPNLKKFFIEKGMACSPYGAPYLFDALYEVKAEDYALELLTSESDRSWMNMIRFGTTVTSEAWDIKYKRNMTWNHAWGASPAYIITRKIFGIEPLEPAFKKVLIRPQPGNLESAEIISPTISGEIIAKINRKQEGALHMEVVIPANTTAKVMLPKPGNKDLTLRVNGKKFPITIEDGSVLIDNLKSGTHTFRLE